MRISCAGASIPIPEEGRRREGRGTRGCERGNDCDLLVRLAPEVEGKGSDRAVKRKASR
jgi:hypothetical protein